MNDELAGLFRGLQEGRWTVWLLATFLTLGTWVTLRLIHSVVKRRVRRRVGEVSVTSLEDIIQHLAGPTRLLIVVLSLLVGLQVVPENIRQHSAIQHGTKILVILCGLWVLDRILGIIFIRFLNIPSLQPAMKRVFHFCARILLFAIALLTILDSVGISITPLLASLGVGSIAVALALQETLGNIFSGFYILLDRPVREGDWIKADGLEGRVTRVGWRSTRIEQGLGNLIIIPNTKLLNSTIINYDMPTHEMVFVVPGVVTSDNDLDRVEKVSLAVAKDVLERIPGGVASATPGFSFLGFQEGGVGFNVALRSTGFTQTGKLKSEFIKALQSRFKAEGIRMPVLTVGTFQPPK